MLKQKKKDKKINLKLHFNSIKKTDYGKFNANLIHSMIYTVIILMKYKNVAFINN